MTQWQPPSFLFNLCSLAHALSFVFAEPPLDGVALTLAPASIISTCAGLSVAWNVLLAPCTLGEQLTYVRAGAAIAIIIGTICMGIFGPHAEVLRSPEEYIALMARPSALVYYAGLAGLVGVLTLLTLRMETNRAFPAALGGSLVGNQFLHKVVTEMINCAWFGSERPGCSADNPFNSWQIWVLGSLALVVSVTGLAVLALALRKSEALDSIPIYQGFQILIGAVSGAMVLQEQRSNNTAGVVLYCLSLLLIVAALALLAIREQPAGTCRVPDRVIVWPCYDDCAASTRRRLDALVGSAGPDLSVKLDKEAAPSTPARPKSEGLSESSRLLSGLTPGGANLLNT